MVASRQWPRGYRRWPVAAENSLRRRSLSFAQPSGLTSDGKWLYVADSEGSSIRAVPLDPVGKVKTVIGTSHLENGRLFEFGDIDGEGYVPRLQHCLGVAWYKGLIYVADTYNNKIKVINADKSSCATLVGTGKSGHDDQSATFDEPAGIAAAAGKLYVADTNNHLIRVVDLENGNRVSTLAIAGLEPPSARQSDRIGGFAGGDPIKIPPNRLKPTGNAVRIQVQLHLPSDYKLNELAPQRYKVELAENGPLDRSALGKSVRLEKPGDTWNIELPIKQDHGADRILWRFIIFIARRRRGPVQSRQRGLGNPFGSITRSRKEFNSAGVLAQVTSRRA